MFNGRLIYIFCLFFLGFCLNIHAEEYTKSTIQVTGNGEISANPDVAYINISVETSSKIAADAVKQNAEKTQNVIKKIKSVISENDKVKTTNYSLYPVYEYDDTAKKQYLQEYRVVNEVLVETYNLDNIANLIDSTTTLGANRINGPRFGLKNSDELERMALVKAVEDARKTAETVSTAAGVKIIKILSINPGYNTPAPYYDRGFESKAFAAESAPTPIEAGDLTITANVTIVYEIE
ncbi:MAG: SIMPL domain-containing protein [Thermodesulfobacteriota bacterium]